MANFVVLSAISKSVVLSECILPFEMCVQILIVSTLTILKEPSVCFFAGHLIWSTGGLNALRPNVLIKL